MGNLTEAQRAALPLHNIVQSVVLGLNVQPNIVMDEAGLITVYAITAADAETIKQALDRTGSVIAVTIPAQPLVVHVFDPTDFDQGGSQ